MNKWIHFKIITATKCVVIQLSVRILPAEPFHWRVKYVGRCRGSNDPRDPSAFPENCRKVCWKHYTLRSSYNTYKVISTQLEYNSKESHRTTDLFGFQSPSTTCPNSLFHVPMLFTWHKACILQMCADRKILKITLVVPVSKKRKAKWPKKTRMFVFIWWESPTF